MSWFCIPCTYSPEQAGESLQTSCLDTLQSALLNSKSIPEEFCCKDNLTAFFQSFPFGTTLRRSASITQKPQACSTNSERYQGNSPFVAGSRSRARISAQPEREQASQDPDQGFGLTWPASSARYDRATSSWKIHPCLFPEDSMSCSVTLPRWGTCVAGVLSERTMPEHLTSGTGSGLWPTPDTRGFTNDGAMELLAKSCDSFEEMSGMAYRKQAKRKEQYWPTPRAGNPGSRPNGKGGKILAEEVKKSLAGAVKMWPTPNASDNRTRGTAASTARRREIGKQIGLQAAVEETAIGGSLNPTWVEWLMAWPLGWTDLKPLATAKFQQWQRSHGGYSHD